MADDVSEMVRNIIQTQVISALNTAPDAIEKLVKSALSSKVDDTGHPAKYSSDNKYPYLDWLVGNEIRMAAHNAVREIIKERAEDIKEHVRAGLSAESLVEAVTKALTKAADEDWRIDVTFAVEEKKRY